MNNITSYNFNINKENRNNQNKHASFLIWFTGLSGSGKSTLANSVEQELYKLGVRTYILDGDNIRKGINNDLTFAPKCRSENIRRIAEISSLMVDAGLVVLASFITPYKNDRIIVNSIIKSCNFVEIFVNTSIEECERRDVKGLYNKVRKGELTNMTGITEPYEVPENPDIEIKTEKESIEQSVKKILDYISPKLKLKHE